MAYGPQVHLSESERASILGYRAVEQALTLMGINEVRERLRGQQGAEALQMHYGQNGAQVYALNGRSVTVPPMATDDEIVTALSANPTQTTKSTMSITGVTGLKAKFEAAKQRAATIAAKADAAVKSYNDAGDIAESAISQLEADAQALLAEVKDSSNGGPI